MQININNVKRRKPQADITNSEKWVRNKNEMNAGPQLMHVWVCVCESPGCAIMCVCMFMCAYVYIYASVQFFTCMLCISWRNKYVCALLIVAKFVSLPAFISAFWELSLISCVWMENMCIGGNFYICSTFKSHFVWIS